MRALVLGGYCLIGSAIAQQLLADGHAVTALGRKRLFKIWFVCGFPAFFAVLAIIWLMSAKPDIAPFWPA